MRITIHVPFTLINVYKAMFSTGKASQKVYMTNNKHDQGTLCYHMTSTVYLQKVKKHFTCK
jgi:hypothetical protein